MNVRQMFEIQKRIFLFRMLFEDESFFQAITHRAHSNAKRFHISPWETGGRGRGRWRTVSYSFPKRVGVFNYFLHVEQVASFSFL